MEPREAALLSSVLHLPAGLTITSVHPSATELVVGLACHTPSMPCPECHQLSTRIHGNYQRTVADLPCAGRNVILMLTVRKFVCSIPTCPRKIFTERLSGLVQSYARMTSRLIALVQALGLGAGGQLGTRLADRVGIASTPPTLLRHLMQVQAPVARAVRVLGLDDFGATRKSRMCSRKNSRKEALTWGSAPKCPTRLNQVRLGQCSRARKSGNYLVRGDYDCQHQAVRS